MTPRERFLTALNGGVPDRIPITEHLFSQKLLKEVLGYNTILYEGKAQAELAAKLGIDAVWTPINGFCGIEETPHEKDEIYKDEWGVTYRKNGWPIIAQIDTPVKSREDWEKYNFPPVDTPYRLRIFKDTKEANAGDLAIVLGALGPFTMLSWYIMDFETLSITMYTDPEMIHEMNEAVLKWTLDVIRLAIADGGVDCVQISDDWGGTNSLLISPDDFRTFFVPYFRRLVEGIKETGVPVIMHNDGRIWDVLDDLVDCGIDGLHPVERAAGMDLKKVKEKYKGKLTPVGNINNKITMASADPEDVRKEVLECIKEAGADGGYIIATDHSIHDLIPYENVKCLIETVKEYGTYPIQL
ncbi:uroporphyrinogen decarboxylase family protein [Parabacteroides sp.]|uniref:uroporphyrinogen decarboxylase family protein n=1 Tax=Parabacteroides sp. TaxID=1869337 RepID=UPI00307FDB5E